MGLINVTSEIKDDTNASRLPNVGAVKKYVDGQNASIQSQIDDLEKQIDIINESIIWKPIEDQN